MAELPGRQERFSSEETELLVREVKARELVIFGDGQNPAKAQSVKQAWEEISLIVSSLTDKRRTAQQCRKRYNDVRRRGKQKLSSQRRSQRQTGGGGPLEIEMTAAEDTAASTIKQESVEGFGGIEVGVECQALTEDPGLGTSNQGSAVVEEEPLRPKGQPQPRPGRHRGGRQPSEDHPFLQLQQAGFDMLERELLGIRHGVRRASTRLARMESLLRPLGRIADGIERLTGAVERLASAMSSVPLASVKIEPSVVSLQQSSPPPPEAQFSAAVVMSALLPTHEPEEGGMNNN